jgi:hypothetical protein
VVRRSGQGTVAVASEWMSFMALISRMGGDGIATVSDSGEREARRSAPQRAEDARRHAVHRPTSGGALVECGGGR